MKKYIVTAWKNNSNDLNNVRESTFYVHSQAEQSKSTYNFFGYHAIITEEEIDGVETVTFKE